MVLRKQEGHSPCFRSTGGGLEMVTVASVELPMSLRRNGSVSTLSRRQSATSGLLLLPRLLQQRHDFLPELEKLLHFALHLGRVPALVLQG